MQFSKISRFVDALVKSQLLDAARCDELTRMQTKFSESRALAQELMRLEWLTAYQINQILQGRGDELILGPFTLLERIGEGGMGQVFKAKQKMLNRVVALKVIRKECLHNKKVTQRFQREIRAAGQLSHPHIVRAFDADQVNGTYYIAMEFIEGVDLAKLVHDEGPLRVDRACEYIRQAALGLQHAFERGLVHRDIKPANLLVAPAVSSDRRRSSGLIKRPINLDERKKNNPPKPDAAQAYPFGIVKILDMGLARCTETFAGRASTHLTQVGSVMGTPEYIAPEQARDSHTSDVRADLYSLGCTLYFLLTGQPPFPKGTLTEKLLQHQTDDPPPVGPVRRERLVPWRGIKNKAAFDDAMIQVPRRVEDVIRKLMAKRPEDRYQTPLELATDLQDIVTGLADGSLAMAEDVERTATIPALTVGSAEAAPQDATMVVLGIAPRQTNPRQAGNRLVNKILVGLVAGGGLAFLIVATVIGVLMSRHNSMQASPVVPDPPVKSRDGDDPPWKSLIKRTAAQRGPWEEARQEIQRQRLTAATKAQAKMFGELWTKLPSPLDELDSAKFDGTMPAGLPADVIGMYGFTKGAAKPVAALAISPSGRWLATNEDNGVRLFDLLGSVIPHKIQAHEGRVSQLAITPDGRTLASTGDDGNVRLWDLATRARLLSFDKHKKPVTQLTFNHDGSLIASAGKDGAIRLWDPRTGSEVRKIDEAGGDISALAFSPDGKAIFWANATRLVTWAHVKGTGRASDGKFDVKFVNARFLAFQPEGDLVLLSNGQGSVSVCTWDGKTLAEKTTLRDHQQIHHAAFAPDGKTFVTVGSEPMATLWNADALAPMKTWKNLRGIAHRAAFAPDGRHLVLGAANSQVYVIRLANHDMTALTEMIETK